jgi:hypothetical protein
MRRQNPLHGWVIKIAPAILGLLLNTPLYDHDHLCKYPERFNTSAMDKKTALKWSLGRRLIAAFKGLPEAPAQVSGVVVSNEILPWKSARIWHGTYGACHIDREHWNLEERRRLQHAFIPIYTLYPSNALKLELLVDQCSKPLRMTAM